MRTFVFMVFFVFSLPNLSAKEMSALDFIVDGKSFDGQEVTVKDCTVVAALSSVVMCSVQSKGRSVGPVVLDGDTLERSALRRSLIECAGMLPIAACKVTSVTGRVRVNRVGDLRIDNAVVKWARP
jgi:hypothetical protein